MDFLCGQFFILYFFTIILDLKYFDLYTPANGAKLKACELALLPGLFLHNFLDIYLKN